MDASQAGLSMSENEKKELERLWADVESTDLAARADALYELGDNARQEENWIDAKGFFSAAFDLYTALGKFQEASRANYSVGFCHYRSEEYSEAVAALSVSLADAISINRTPGIAYSAAPLADSFVELGRSNEAINAYKIAISSFAELDELLFAGINAMALGELYGQQKDFDRALEVFVQAYNFFQTAGDAGGSARAKDRMASALIELGDHKQAQQFLNDALTIFEKIDDAERVAFTKYRIGWTFNLRELHLKAQKPLRDAIRYFKSVSNLSLQSAAELQLCESLIFSKVDTQSTEAITLAKQLISYFEAVGEQSNHLVAKSLLASKDQAQGEYKKSLSAWNGILKEAKKLEFPEIIEYSQVAVIECLVALGQLEKAKKELQHFQYQRNFQDDTVQQRVADLQNLIEAA